MGHVVRERNGSLNDLTSASCQPRQKISNVVTIVVKGATIKRVSLYIEVIQIRILKCPLTMLNNSPFLHHVFLNPLVTVVENG